MDLWRFDGGSENDLGGIYLFNDWRAETPWGHSRPDYTRAEVRRSIVDNALMWLDEYRVDGTIRFPVEGTWRLRFHCDWSGHSERFEGGEGGDVTAGPGECDGRPCRGRVSMPPCTAMILSRDRKSRGTPALQRRPGRRGRPDRRPPGRGRMTGINRLVARRPDRGRDGASARGALRL